MIRGRGIGWLRRSRQEIDADVAEELAFHLEMRRAELERSGMQAADADARARAELGDSVSLRAALRAADLRVLRRRRVAHAWETLLHDSRFALRSLRRSPGFTAAALATLSVGIGATVATFTVLNAVVLRPLPYADADRLVSVQYGGSANTTIAEEIERRGAGLEAVSAISEWGLTLTGAGDAVELSAQVVEPEYFSVFRVRPLLGRVFREDERSVERSDVVLVSHALWRERFGADPTLIGRRIQLDGYAHRTREVIGVMPPHFRPPLGSPGQRTDAWIPLRDAAGRTLATDSTWYLSAIVARLAPGATVASAAASVREAMDALRAESSVLSEEAVQAAGAVSLAETVVGSAGRTLWLLLGAVALVLVLACANLANLLMARGERRRPELAARAALGAGRGRLVRELFTESAILALSGAALGTLLARGLLAALRVPDASGLPRAAELGFDVRVAAFAAGAAAFSALLFGILPALRVSADGLRAAAGTPRVRGDTRGARRVGSALIATEAALAMTLATCAALLIQSYRTLAAVEPGLDTSDVLTARIAPPANEYPADRARAFYAELTMRVGALPAVRSVGAIQLLPFNASNWDFPYLAAGHEPPAGQPLPSANFRVVNPAYFAALDIPVIAGRTFDARDRGDAEAVGIINQALAERLWPGEDPVGREILLFGNVPFRVVGVVGDVRQHGIDQPARAEMYRPHAQWTLATMQLMVEHEGDPVALESALRSAVRDLDPHVPVSSVAGLTDVLHASLAQRRFVMRVLAGFGAVALLLGAIGVYGVSAYTATARTPEFGVRIALGASAHSIQRTAFVQGMTPVIIGTAAGMVGSLGAGKLMASLLYDTAPDDVRVLAAAACLLLLVAAAASWLPARRCSRVHPMRVLGSQ